MKFNVTFYPHICMYDGYRIQNDKPEKTEILSTKQLKDIADLRHPVLNKSEFFKCHSLDRKGNVRTEFSLLARGNYHLVIKPIMRA